jgi:hypothetical protein
VTLFLGLGLLSDALAPAPSGPVSSSYATNAGGLAAWAELARRAGRTVVQLREPLDRSNIKNKNTLVILDPDALLHSEGTRLLEFVRGGGRLVIGGHEPQGALLALYPDPPGWSPGGGGETVHRPVANDPALTGVREVRGAGEGEWSETKGARTLLSSSNAGGGAGGGAGADTGGAILIARALGRGEVYMLADASPLQNARLAQADNALLALGLAGPPARALVFVESLHGFGASTGLAALPGPWKLAFALLGLAALLWVAARGPRLGPPEPTPAAGQPPRLAHVEALALLLRRSAGRRGRLR